MVTFNSLWPIKYAGRLSKLEYVLFSLLTQSMKFNSMQIFNTAEWYKLQMHTSGSSKQFSM